MTTIGHDGAILTIQGYSPAEALEGAAVEELPVSGDVLSRELHYITGFPVSYAEGQLWR